MSVRKILIPDEVVLKQTHLSAVDDGMAHLEMNKTDNYWELSKIKMSANHMNPIQMVIDPCTDRMIYYFTL